MYKNVQVFVRTLLVVSCLMVQIGCSAFRSGRQDFNVTASEPDAKIYINNQLMGTGSASVRVARNKSVFVMARKDGYKPVTRVIENTLSATGVMDTIGGWLILVPFIGLAFPGAYSLEENNVNLVFFDEDRNNLEK